MRVTRNGQPSFVLVSPDELASLEETLDILTDDELMASLRQSRREAGERRAPASRRPRLSWVINRADPPSPRQVVRLSKIVHEHPLTPELTAVLLAAEQREEFEPAFLATLDALVRLRGARPGIGLTADQLAQIEPPVQLIWGDDDPFGSPDVGRRAADELPHAEFHVAPGGHAPR